MRDNQIQVPGEEGRIRVGPHPSHRHLRQGPQASQCGLRQLRHKVGHFRKFICFMGVPNASLFKYF